MRRRTPRQVVKANVDRPAPNPPHRLASQQARFNRSTRDHWPHFASHRDWIERLLVADGLGGGGRLCVLGAGNCNDLDLPALAEAFDEIHLVDLDPPRWKRRWAGRGCPSPPEYTVTHRWTYRRSPT